ncbi:mariner-Tc1 transposon family protein [Penicillium crustosum]|uniref:mariner-Tc1 transposon family protein n=2 Tax=Penicillium crustosum TaxID=36656 RepID=UPI00239C8D4C|nr:mariner-Tc1 transposon family protein [Penicillium crustosum]KAJ5410950.1 mariner-Tc1 transposon family protein [Penicillium crustosum]
MPRRVAISIEQKQALRAHRRAFPTFPNIELKRWFEAKYQQVISTSSVSEILSAKYTHLDNPINRTQSQKRFRQEFWPELEDALFQWIQRVEATITISLYTIREKAEFF